MLRQKTRQRAQSSRPGWRSVIASTLWAAAGLAQVAQAASDPALAAAHQAVLTQAQDWLAAGQGKLLSGS